MPSKAEDLGELKALYARRNDPTQDEGEGWAGRVSPLCRAAHGAVIVASRQLPEAAASMARISSRFGPNSPGGVPPL